MYYSITYPLQINNMLFIVLLFFDGIICIDCIRTISTIDTELDAHTIQCTVIFTLSERSTSLHVSSPTFF